MTYQTCRYLAKLFLFWLILFALNRLVFLFVQAAALADIPFSEMLAAFYHGLPLDVSAACYSCAFPFLVLWAAYLTGYRGLVRVLMVLVIVQVFLHCAMAFGDAALYTEWHTKLNWKALAHFRRPSEVFKSASAYLTVLFFSTTLVLGLAYVWAYVRWVHPRSLGIPPALPKRWLPALTLFPLVGFIVFSGIRGGWKRFPISVSIAYYSQEAVLNDAAVNPAWYLLHDIRQETLDVNENPYHWMAPQTASAIVDSLFRVPKDTTVRVLTTTRPNIMLFILESWPRDMVRVPGHPEISPVFDSLAAGGIFFDSCYATGYVSDEGIPGILSAFPTSAHVSVLTEPQKTVGLPAINELLDSVGYHSGFIYGGQLDFGNIRSYVYNKHFDVVKAGRDFPVGLPRGALGVPDAVMAPYAADIVRQAPQPFFYCWYTLSTHPPYDHPANQWLPYGGRQIQLVNTLHYADSSLGVFLHRLREEPWYANTLFVFVSDHSHDTQYGKPSQHRDRNAIPLLFYGDVIKPAWRGRIMHQVTSQLDIAATLLAQLNLPSDRFPWSKNAFNPYGPRFAAINYLTGAGFIVPGGYVSLQDQFPDFLLTNLTDTVKINRLKRIDKAFEQTAYGYFLGW